METVRKTIAPGEQEEEGEKVGDESHHLGQADPPTELSFEIRREHSDSWEVSGFSQRQRSIFLHKTPP